MTKFPMHVDEMYIILSHLGSRKDMIGFSWGRRHGRQDVRGALFWPFGGHYLEYILDS